MPPAETMMSRMTAIAERDGTISYPDVVNILRGTMDGGGISYAERQELQRIADRSVSFRAKDLVHHFFENLEKHRMLYGRLKVPAFAFNRICDFLMKSDSGKFPGLSRDQVGVELIMRIAEPGLIDQGKASLCGPSSLLFTLAKHKPLEYVNFAADLFDHGRARIGNLEIRPGSDCRNYRPSSEDIPQVDWLTAASIRDSENWFFDYDSVGDEFAGMTTPGELHDWFKKAGFSDVYGDSETWRLFTKAPARMIDKTNELHQRGYRVCLLINDQLMYSNKHSSWSIIAKHWVVLTSPIQRTPSVKFNVFSWGNGNYDIPHPHWDDNAKTFRNKPLTESNLREHLFGIVAAKP